MRRLVIPFILVFILAAALVSGIMWWRIERPLEALPIKAFALAPPAPPRIGFTLPSVIPEFKFKRGDRIGEIEVPRLKLKVAVYEGDDAAILNEGAGHVPGTALPGGEGNICIAAHRDKFFRALRFIKPRDEIVLETKDGPLRYLVSSTAVVNPSDVQALMPAPRRDLTLVTCYPFFYVGSAPHRFIVHASRVATQG
ncbi:MAG TPA: class D sortase [Bryobacteraceae bacterium]|nr:class D sortase [Bryobacteraceae bacterium]